MQLNAEFQRRTRRDKKAFLNEQYKEIEENNRMGKTGDIFPKIGVIKGHIICQAWDISTYHARIGTIKDRNSKDLTEAEEIKKREHEYTELLKKKVLMT